MDYGLPFEAIKRIQTLFQLWPQVECVWIYGSRAHQAMWKIILSITDIKISDNK